MDAGSSRCPGCDQSIRAGDEFCQACGAKVPDEMRAAPRDRLRSRRSARGGYAARSRSRNVKKAAAWILILGILFAVFGTIFGFITKSQEEDALRMLSGYEDAETLVLEGGETRTAGELREEVRGQARMVFLSNYVLAAIMVGLHFWARKNAFPAIVTAFIVFLAVQLLNVLVDPKTLVQGIVIKVIVVVVFVGGIKAALAERAANRGGRRHAGWAPGGPGP